MAPRTDGSGLEVGVDTTKAPNRESAKTSTEAGGIPLTMRPGGEAETASRDFDAGPDFIAGADITTPVPGGVRACSSSFAIFAYYGGSWEEQLLTAHHCANGSSTGTWKAGNYTNSPVIGTDIASPAASDIAVIRGKDYAPYMYYGPNTSNVAVAIFGYAVPIVGATVCYSGAPTGTVCNNEVTHVNVTVSYPGLTYSNQVRTVQRLGTPAAGNGDSGGPVFGVNASSQALAVGVISGMQNASANCTGDPATSTRSCSATLFYAPVVDHFASTGIDDILTYSP